MHIPLSLLYMHDNTIRKNLKLYSKIFFKILFFVSACINMVAKREGIIMANIINIRIDERLIHGQVAAFWTNSLNITRLMVIDDIAAADEIQKMALKMACPSTVKLSILNVNRAAEKLNNPELYVGERLFVVVRGVETIRKLVDLNVNIETVTVGNMSNKIGSKRVYHTVCVTPKDIDTFNELSHKGIKFIAQMVPSDQAEDFMGLLSKIS